MTLYWGLLVQMLHVHSHGMQEVRIEASQTVYIVPVHLCCGRPQLDPFAESSWQFTWRFRTAPCGVHALKQLCVVRDCT